MRSSRLALAVTLLLAACVTHIDAPTAIQANLPLAMVVVGGDGQTGVAGVELPNPLVVRVEDSKGHRVTGQIVSWRVVTGGGSVFAGVAITNKDGEARERWTLGTAGPQRVEARAVDPDTGDPLTFGVFNATALPSAQLSISESSFSFGAVPVGTTTALHVFTVTNTGGVNSGVPILALTGAQAADFTVSSNCTAQLTPGGSCGFGVTYHPAAAGASSATVTVSASPGGTVSAALSGSGFTPAVLVLTPPSFNYGNVNVGSFADHVFTLTNTGGSPSAVPVGAIAGPDASMFTVIAYNCTTPLAPGASCTGTVRFAPTSAGVKSATLAASASPGGIATTTVTGTGVASASLSLSPGSWDFGSVPPGTSVNQDFTLTNTGGAPAGLLAFSVSGPDAPMFAIAGTTCASGLNAAASCIITVRFTPASTGPKSAALIASATPGGTASSPLTGGGAPPPILQLVPPNFDYGTVAIGSAATPHGFTLTNVGGSPTTGIISFAVTPPGGSGFSISGSTCGATLAPLASCSITVDFAPLVTGSAHATLNVSAGGANPVAATLSGLGVPPASLIVAPAPFNFGNVTVGSLSPTQSFTITNSGGSVTAGAPFITLTGPNPTQFVLVSHTCNAPLPPSGTCSATLQFAPQVAGSLSATLAVSAGSASGFALLSGTGAAAGAAVLSVSQSPFDFSRVPPGTTANATFVVTNTGNAGSGPIGASFNGPFFTTPVNTCNLGLSPGQQCVIQVQFTPLSVVPVNVQLSLSSASGATAAISLTAAVDISASHSTMLTSAISNNFAPGATFVFTFVNNGPQATTALSTSLVGANVADFQIVGNTCQGTVLPVSISCIVAVRFTPATSGSKAAGVQVTMPSGPTNMVAVYGILP